MVLLDESVHEVQEVYEVQEAPPAPVPAPLARPLSIPELIDAAAYRWGVSAARMRCIAWRESSYRPWVTSPDGRYRGLWQFSRSTFEWGARNAGYPADWNLAYDPVVSTEVALWVITHPLQGGGWGHWGVIRLCR